MHVMKPGSKVITTNNMQNVNKATPKMEKKSAFEMLNEIYLNEDRTTFPKRAAVERLHVELHAKNCTVSSNQLCV